MRLLCSTMVLALATFEGVFGTATAQAQTAAGAAVFQRQCASCHATGATDQRAPTLEALRLRTPERVLDALLTSSMRIAGSRLSGTERRAVAEYVTNKKFGTELPASTVGRCSSTVTLSAPFSGPYWNGWGVTPTNTRFQPAEQAGLDPERVAKLTLKWAFGFPDTAQAWAQPSIAGGRLFVGSQAGTVYSLDARTGCIYWTFSAKTGVRTGMTLGSIARPDRAALTAVYFADMGGTVYALDAATGELVWTRRVEEHPLVRITGTPTLFEDKLFVPVSSFEESQSSQADYQCCTFRGSVVSLDAATGTVAWKAYTFPQEPQPLSQTAQGVQQWGPAGGAVWAAPTIDAKRRAVYVATGNNYSPPQQQTADAVLALDLDTGRVRWAKQLTTEDIFPCRSGRTETCGPDFDFGNSAILTASRGRDVIVIGQKSGIGWALDPEQQGAVLWQYEAGTGSTLGGMEWGSAADPEHVYFPVSDVRSPEPGGLHAVKLETGDRAWFTPPPPLKCGSSGPGCNGAQSAAITVIPGVVFSGSVDGGLRAFSTKNGAVIWEYDTNREFQTVNGVPAKGASINGPGPVVAGGMLYVNSGYGFAGSRPGNVLLAFGVD